MTVPTYALDSSVIVAAVLGWHEHHNRSRSALERALEIDENGRVFISNPDDVTRMIFRT